MTTDKKELIELYKITLEELRHHDRIYWQALIGLGVIITVFLAVISFLFGKDTPLSSEAVYSAKWALLSFAIFLAVIFALAIYRINSRAKISQEVIRKIECTLRGKQNTEETSELDGLLVRRELDKAKFDKWFAKYRFCFYIPVGVLFLIGLWYFLFNIITGS